MQSPATASVGLTFPPVPSYNPQPLGVPAVAVPYTAIIPGEQIPIAGAGTYVVDLAMMPATGLAYLSVSVGKVDATGGAVTAPVKVVFTNGFQWVAPGGFMTIATPGLTSGGITAVSLVTTAPAVATVVAAG